MSKTKTVTEQTIHGSIEYEVIECDSCGQDVMEDEARDFTIGDREGYACDACVDEGPVSFPERKFNDTLLWIPVISLFWPVVLLIPILEFDPDSPFDRAWITASLGASLWMFLIGYNVAIGAL